MKRLSHREKQRQPPEQRADLTLCPLGHTLQAALPAAHCGYLLCTKSSSLPLVGRCKRGFGTPANSSSMTPNSSASPNPGHGTVGTEMATKGKETNQEKQEHEKQTFSKGWFKPGTAELDVLTAAVITPVPPHPSEGCELQCFMLPLLSPTPRSWASCRSALCAVEANLALLWIPLPCSTECWSRSRGWARYPCYTSGQGSGKGDATRYQAILKSLIFRREKLKSLNQKASFCFLPSNDTHCRAETVTPRKSSALGPDDEEADSAALLEIPPFWLPLLVVHSSRVLHWLRQTPTLGLILN